MGETPPVSKADILRALPDDAEVDTRRGEGELPAIPTKGRSSLISRGAASALTPPRAGSGPSAAPSSASGARVPTPQAPTLSGFRLPKRKVGYVAVDQLTPSAKKRKEDAAAAPPSAQKGGDNTRTSPARSPSRGQEEHRQEESAPLAPEVPVPGSADEAPKAQKPSIFQALVTTSPPPPAVRLAPNSFPSSTVLEGVLSEMAKLREDLLGADPRLVAGRLELASGWLHSDSAVQASLSQAAAASEKEKRAAAKAAVDREAALKDAEATRDRCRELEGELKSLRDERAKEAHGREAKEEDMKAREDTIKGRNAELAEPAKAQAAERS
nr:atherin-like [Aegilops tauschii subsp. strangulata]